MAEHCACQSVTLVVGMSFKSSMMTSRAKSLNTALMACRVLRFSLQIGNKQGGCTEHESFTIHLCG
eukprot:4345458-Amphidinium_carterae.1